MLDWYRSEIYGEAEWMGRRSAAWRLFLCTVYALVSAGFIVALLHGLWGCLLPGMAVILLSLWRVDRLHDPVVILCPKALLVAAPWKRIGSWRDYAARSAYFVVAYESIAGIASRWDALYIGTEEIGGLVEVPAPLLWLARKDQAELCRRIEEKKRSTVPWEQA